MAMDVINRDELLFYITKETMQNEAMMKIGRHLTEDELNIVKDGLEWGLTTDIDTVYNTIMYDMIQKRE